MPNNGFRDYTRGLFGGRKTLMDLPYTSGPNYSWLEGNDPFAKYATSKNQPLWGNLGNTAKQYFGQLDPQKTYAALFNQLQTNPGVSGGVRNYASDPRNYQKLYGNYQALEAQNIASGGVPKQSWYDYLQNQGQDLLRNSFYKASPQERGFSLGGGPPMSRTVRSF